MATQEKVARQQCPQQPSRRHLTKTTGTFGKMNLFLPFKSATLFICLQNLGFRIAFEYPYEHILIFCCFLNCYTKRSAYVAVS